MSDLAFPNVTPHPVEKVKGLPLERLIIASFSAPGHSSRNFSLATLVNNVNIWILI